MAEKQTPKKLKRPKETQGTTYKIEVGCGHLYVTAAKANGDLIEVFATLGKAGGCAMSQLEALTRSISLGLKFGVPTQEYINELEFIRCPSPALNPNEEVSDSEQILSCADAIAKVLKKELEKKGEANDKKA